jgi:ribonuclease HI
VHCRRTPAVEVLAGRIYRDYRALIKPAFKAVGVEKDKSAARIEFAELLSSLPPSSCHIFTDGSCKAKESGGGYAVFRGPLPDIAHSSSHYLGKGTNNTAEAEAVCYALRHIINIVTLKMLETVLPVFFFTDSKYVLDLVNGVTTPRTNLVLIRKLKGLVVRAKAMVKISFFKVPGHANIFQNEVVDALAKRGAGGISSTFPLPLHVVAGLRRSAADSASRDGKAADPPSPTPRRRRQPAPPERHPNPKRHKNVGNSEPVPRAPTSARGRGSRLRPASRSSSSSSSSSKRRCIR